MYSPRSVSTEAMPFFSRKSLRCISSVTILLAFTTCLVFRSVRGFAVQLLDVFSQVSLYGGYAILFQEIIEVYFFRYHTLSLHHLLSVPICKGVRRPIAGCILPGQSLRRLCHSFPGNH